MGKVASIITDQSVTFYIGTEAYTVEASVPTFGDIKAELRSADPDEKRLIALATPITVIRESIEAAVEEGYLPAGKIIVTPSQVRFNGEALHSVLTDRILALLAEGFDVTPWVEFLSNLFQNPIEAARDELYEFLEVATLPITPDGCFLAYKIVGPDYKDLYSGNFDNSPGQTVTVPRSSVDKNRNRTCSTGLHFCSKEYLPNYGTESGNRVVLVKINPADVVSIPTDYNYSKGRTWKYEVVGEIDRKVAASKVWPSYTDEYEADDDDGYDEDAYNEDGVDDEILDFESDPESPADEAVIDSPSAGRLTAGVLLALKKDHGSWNGVARHFGVSTGTVSSWVEKLGLRGQ